MYKHFTNQLPEVFRNYFCTHNEIHNYRTRHNNSYILPKIKTDFAYKTVKTMGPVKWNALKTKLNPQVRFKLLENKLEIILLQICLKSYFITFQQLLLKVWLKILLNIICCRYIEILFYMSSAAISGLIGFVVCE